MRISNIKIKNFRSIKDADISVDPYTALIGPNGAGKSTILCALNIFFRENDASPTNIADLDIEDFHDRSTDAPIEITVTFDDLSPAAKDDFAGYVRHNRLVITSRADFNSATGTASVFQYGQRSAMKSFAPFFELFDSGALAPALKAKFTEIRRDYPGVAEATVKSDMRDALRSYEEAHPELCELIPSRDQFYGFSRGGDRLARHVQWIYVPAVKDATKEINESKGTALGKILARAVRAKVSFDTEIQKIRAEAVENYKRLIDTHQSALNDISDSLTTRLRQWAHPAAKARVEWIQDAKRSIQIEEPSAKLFAGEGFFEGEIARFGHGLQRSYLLALLQELASADDPDAPTLILGCEEPELYQHPPQARHLSAVLQKLSRENAQVLITTHSPYFVAGATFESVRMVRCDVAAKRSHITSVTYSAVAEKLSEVTGETVNARNAQAARLHQALQVNINDMFFSSRIIFVEGLEDLGYIISWLVLTNRIDDLRSTGCHILTCNGKDKIIEPLIVAQALNIPAFAIFDSDGNVAEEKRKPHLRDNKALLALLGGDISQPFPASAVWSDQFIQWPINFGHAVKSDVPSQSWDKAYGAATKGLGNPEGNYSKNMTHIGDHLLHLMTDGASPACLEQVCQRIVKFARGD